MRARHRLSTIAVAMQSVQDASYTSGPLGQSNSSFAVGFYDRIHKTLGVGGASVKHFAYVERRSACYVFIEQTSVVVGFDLFEKRALRHVSVKSFKIKTNASSVSRQMIVLKAVLMREQLVVHLPEVSLRAGRFSCFSCAQRMRMSSRSGEVPKGKAQIVAHQFLHFFDYRIGTTAMNAFKVAVFEQRHRRIGRSGNVVALRNPRFLI